MQPLTPAAENIPTIQPLVVRFPELDAVNCVEFSADGKTLYAEVPAEVLDLGQVVLNWGVWLGVALVILLTLAAALTFWRIAQKPRTKGTLYCRKCNYEVGPTITGGGTQCTECGTAFSSKRPIVGRAHWKRRIPALVMTSLALAGATALTAPQSRKAALNWAAAKAGVSRSLFVQLNKRSVTIPTSLVQDGVLLLELDATTGNRIRTIRVRGVNDTAFAGICLMPDGEHLVCGTANEVQSVRLRDGKTVANFQPGDNGMQWDRDRSFFQGFCDAGKSVLFSYWERNGEVAKLVAWTPSTGASRTLATSPFKTQQVSTGNSTFQMELGRELKVCTRDAGGNVTSVVSVPTFAEAYHFKSYEMECFDIATGTRRSWDLGNAVSPSSSPAISADGAVGFVFADDKSLMAFDPSNGNVISTLSYDGDLTEQHRLVNNDQWLLIPLMQDVRVRDIVQKRWVASLAFPQGDLAPKITTSRTSDRVAAVVMTPRKSFMRNGGPRYTFELVIWNVSSLHKTPSTLPAPK